jgi:hypothetical protein
MNIEGGEHGLKKFSKTEAIKFGWRAVNEDLGFLIILLITATAISSSPRIIQWLAAENIPIASYLFFAAEWALGSFIAMGMLKIWLKYADGIKGEFRDLFSCAPLFFKYLFGSILYTLIVLSGLVLLVIPGLFFFI